MALSCSRRILAHLAKLSWALTAFISFLRRSTSRRSRSWSCASLLEFNGSRAENCHSWGLVSMLDAVLNGVVGSVPLR